MQLDIFDLSKLISKQQVISFGLFNDQKSKKESKYFILFTNIVDNKVSTDKEAETLLKYKNHSSYLKFKRRYIQKILDYIILTEGSLNITDALYEKYGKLLKLFTVARITHLLGQKNNAIALYHVVLKQAIKNGFTDLQLLTVAPLKSHYAFIQPNKKLFKEFSELQQSTLKSYEREINLNIHYDKISHNNLMLNSSDFESFKEETILISQNLLNDLGQEDTFQYKIKVHEIASFAFNLNNEFEKSISLSKKSIAINNEYQYNSNAKLYTAYKDIMSAYLKLNDFVNAKIYLDKILSLFTKPTHNYFRIKGLEYSLYANSKSYDKLFELTYDVLSKRELQNQIVYKEEWSIREAFTNILIESGQVSEDLVQKYKVKKFKLNKFINDVEFYSKDKRGSNISIHIVQLIHFLIYKDYEKIHDKLDALNQYTYRYLRNDDTLRSNCFIKMLLKLPEAEYHPLRTRRYVTKYEQKLKENPYEISLKEIEVEIIPYEHLWEIIMRILGENSKKKNKTKTR